MTLLFQGKQSDMLNTPCEKPRRACCEVRLPFFAEVRDAEGLRRLILLLFAHGDHEQDKDRDHVGEHLEQLQRASGQAGDVVIRQIARRDFHVAKMTSATASQPRASIVPWFSQVPLM